MFVDIGIYGLSSSGKSVLFDLLTGLPESGDRGKTRIGSVTVPDPRLDQLVNWYHSRKVTPIHLELHDPGLGHSEKSEDSLSDARLNLIRSFDIIALVVRCYESESVVHPEGTVNPSRDLDLLLTQLILADLEMIERRLVRIEESFRKLPKDDREAYEHEKQALQRIKQTLESESPWETTTLSDFEKKKVSHYSLFHMKRYVVVGNLGDCSASQDAAHWAALRESCQSHRIPCVGVNLKLELEMKDMDPSEAQEFRESMNLESESCRQLVKGLYDQLGMTTFYTAGEKESAARCVVQGTLAPQAAGTIHSDLERGFIRAEVFSFDDLVKAEGSEPKVKQLGCLRIEGKDYVVQDGDIVLIRFSA